MRLGRGSRHLQFERLHQVLKVFVFLYQQAIGFLSTIDLSLLFLLDDAQVERDGGVVQLLAQIVRQSGYEEIGRASCRERV